MNKNTIAALVLALAPLAASAEAGALTGFYAGAALGYGAPSTTVEDSDCWYDCSAYTNRATGATYGITVGQNLTNGSFLFGWDLDYDFASLDESYSYGYYTSPNLYMQANSEFKGALALKAKAGLLIQDTALALSFGWARGDFDNELRDRNGTSDPSDDTVAKSDDALNGLVYGASVQHSIGSNLIVSGSIQKFMFDTDTVYMEPDTNNYNVRFVNDLDQFRIGIAYKFF
jgi:hypothetical protein